MSLAGLVIAALVAGMPVAGGPAPVTADGPPAGRIRTWPLDEGTTAVFLEDRRAPLVFLRIAFAAGGWSPWARHEHAHEAFEIQLFDPEGSLRGRADRLSMELDLSFGRRTSRLTASFHRDDLRAALEVVGDILCNPSFDRSELQRRRRGRQVGWASRLKDPWFRSRQAEARVLFAKGDPRRLDFEEPLDLLTRPERLHPVRDVLVRLPGRVVALAGDVSREEAAAALAGLLPPVLGKDEPLPDVAPLFADVVPASGRRETVVTLPGLTQVYLRSVRDSLPVTHPDYPALLLADHVLGGHFYSRLSVALRHETGSTYGAGTEHRENRVAGPYALWTFTRAGNAGAAEARLREVLARFHQEGITEEERREAAGFLLGRQPFRRQSPGDILDRHLRERRLGLPPGGLDALETRAARLPLKTINAFIRRFYDPAGFTMIRVAPKSRSGR